MIKTILMSLLLVVVFILTMVLSPVIFILNVIRKIFRKDDLYKYMRAITIGLDQVGGSLLYGTKDWTISSYTYILHDKGVIHATYFMYFINWLWEFVTEVNDHCKKAHKKEKRVHELGGI